MTYIEAQALAVFGQVLRVHAEVVSGTYKLRQLDQGCGKNEDGSIKFRPLTDEEKLQHGMQTLQAQVHRLADIAEAIGEREGK